MNVPDWLGHLRTDDRGRPVPYINLWGPGRWTIRPDPNIVGRTALFMDEEPGDPPDFTRQNIQRQRECMYQGLCQVCGRPVPWRRRMLVLGALSVRNVEVDGKRMTVVTEPWLDPVCAGFALKHCPHLIRRRRGEELAIVTEFTPERCVPVVSQGWVDGPLEAESKRLQPAMWVKMHIPAIDVPEARTQ